LEDLSDISQMLCIGRFFSKETISGEYPFPLKCSLSWETVQMLEDVSSPTRFPVTQRQSRSLLSFRGLPNCQSQSRGLT
jgi:hypothetical protein